LQNNPWRNRNFVWTSIFGCPFFLLLFLAGCFDYAKNHKPKLEIGRIIDWIPDQVRDDKKGSIMSATKPIFVVQKHAASHLHYDFRLEIGGVLVSWAIPKGLSANPAEKHLAMPTPDHEYSYAKFEGVLPEGSYGAGAVMVWDTGTYHNIKHHDGKLVPMDECVKNGHVEVWLDGHKLKGGYALIKTHMHAKPSWLCIKMNDEHAVHTKKAHYFNEDSVLSGRTIEQIAKEG